MPLAVRAQQNERIRRLGVLQPFATDAPEKARVAAFVQELQRLGWTDGRNLQIEYRWETTRFAESGNAELVALSPDVILVSTTQAVSSMQTGDQNECRSYLRRSPTRSVPALSQVMAKPGGNMTGFTVFDYEIGAKWLGTAQGDRSQRDACRRHQRSNVKSDYRPARRGSGRCAAVQAGRELRSAGKTAKTLSAPLLNLHAGRIVG